MSAPCPQCGRAGQPLRALVRRSAITSAVVGSALLAINQGDALFSGRFPPSLWWRVPLTYLVPFMVSLHAASLASRR